MVYARAAGFAVPAVEEVSADGTEMVMEYVPGPTMLEALAADPASTVSRCERLADLAVSLHAITAPQWLAPGPVEAGPNLVHLDLHPLNVIESPRGPVVLDWANAARGSGRVDAALSWLLLLTGGDGGRGLGAVVDDGLRAAAAARFSAVVGEPDVREVLAEVVEWRSRDRNVGPDEIAAARRLRDQVSASGAK